MKYTYCLLFLLALIPQFMTRDFTPDNELRYLSIADENLGLHRYFAFLHHGVAYADKPPLYLWLVMLAKNIVGHHNMLILGLFSALPALAIIYTLYRWTADYLSAEWRLMAPLMLFSSLFFIGGAAVIRMDMLMTMFIVLALHTFYRMYLGKVSLQGGQWIFGIFIFLAVFTKGPMGVIIPLLSPVVFLLIRGKLSTFTRYWNWRTLLAIVIPSFIWFYFVWLEGGHAYLQNLLLHQTVDRAVDAFHHKRPFYFYGISIWYVLAPWSIMIFTIYGLALKKRVRLSDLELFFAVVFGTTFLFLSFVSSKVDIYLLPCLPFLVYLAALLQNRMSESRLLRFCLAIPAVIFFLAAPSLLILPAFMSVDISLPLMLCCAILSLSGIAGFYFIIVKRTIARTVFTLGAGLLATVFIAGCFVAQYNADLGYGELAAAGKSLYESENVKPCYVSLEIKRPENMDVYLAAPVQAVSKEAVISGQFTGCILFLNRQKTAANEPLQEYLKSMLNKEVANNAAYKLVQ
ncbi:ArnT family glycosyltransferase [Sphingobacterium deserti]|uniref:Dolichyl-phosphate-mannose-protein mannosyltransferase family protein n=1 Tax=Sphingobacterium deserti TaxID=1229276 RepID=A0A0B8T5A5_9SPHI|nr:glycosyltransferase family 39 protein [Sphingobacterium deserti]KGE12704.1 dolichyl-phosphate-mannose-protein mannosyltransferase family protein [Sphingobacterium deserti]